MRKRVRERVKALLHYTVRVLCVCVCVNVCVCVCVCVLHHIVLL